MVVSSRSDDVNVWNRMAYLTMMMVVWCVMNVLGEVVSYLPLKGLSIPYFVDRFVDPSLAFASGWNYW